jgi:predicted AlkP superfamily pyrophosphatase or phosphodiesterase
MLSKSRSLIPSVLVLSVFTAGCGSARYLTSSPRPAGTPDLPAHTLTRHVVLVSIDGLRPDAIERFAAPTLQRLTREGSYTLGASTITPSKTLPSHTSMLTGEPPERHGVLWNNVVTADADILEQPTVFGVARARGYVTAAFFSKAKFQPLQQIDSLDYSQAPGGWFGRWSSERTVADVEKYLASSRPNLLFVHLADPDRAGHESGWMSVEYGRAVAESDAALSRLLAASNRAFGRGKYTLIVTADHGGHDRDHGSDDPRDVTIPWIVWGQGVKAGELHDAAVRTMDTASTVLWLLGVDEPGDWAGSPVTTAFTEDAQVS